VLFVGVLVIVLSSRLLAAYLRGGSTRAGSRWKRKMTLVQTAYLRDAWMQNHFRHVIFSTFRG